MQVQEDVDVIRSFLRDYDLLQQKILLEINQPITSDDLIKISYPNGQQLEFDDKGDGEQI
jgi:hypothetical protein